MAPSVLFWDLADPADRGLALQLAQCGLLAEVMCGIDSGLAWVYGQHKPALVLIRTDDGSALELCQSVRMLCNVPIVVLCAKADEDLVVGYLKSGADRVLIGSPTRRELKARIDAVLAGRRSSTYIATGSSACHIGELVINPNTHVVTKKGCFISLTPTEFRLLVALARRAGMIATHEELLAEVWGIHRAPSRDTVRHYIGYLRRKLGDSRRRPRLILNQRAIGYKLARSGA